MLDIDDDDDAGTTGPGLNTNEAPPGPDGPTQVTRELECALSDTEVRERGELMAADEREIERLKIRRKALNAQIRAKFEHMTELALAIDSRKEVREVSCTWRPDYQKKIWELQRDDTKVVHETRAMSAIDLQVRLPLDSVAAVDAADDADVDDRDADVGADAAAGVVVELAPDASVVDLLPAESTPEARAVMTRTSRGTYAAPTARAPKAARVTTPAKPAAKRGTAAARHANGKRR